MVFAFAFLQVQVTLNKLKAARPINLLRIFYHAAVNEGFFFKIAGQNLTIVEVDASYICQALSN